MTIPLRKSLRKGFTLLELMIAIALVGLLLVGLNYFIFSMGELWGHSSEKRLFEQHVRSVTRYLEGELRLAAMPPYAKKGTQVFTPMEIRPSGGFSEVLLTFDLPEGSRLLNWPERRLPEVVCSLQVRADKGLYLLWHSRLERRFEEDPPREVLVSPFINSIAYDYFDAETQVWTTEKTPKKDNQTGKYPSPQRIRIGFLHDGYVKESVIALPELGEGLPNF